MRKFNFQNVDIVSIQGKGCAIVVNKGKSFSYLYSIRKIKNKNTHLIVVPNNFITAPTNEVAREWKRFAENVVCLIEKVKPVIDIERLSEIITMFGPYKGMYYKQKEYAKFEDILLYLNLLEPTKHYKEAPRFVFPEEYKTHSEVYTLKGAKQ